MGATEKVVMGLCKLIKGGNLNELCQGSILSWGQD